MSNKHRALPQQQYDHHTCDVGFLKGLLKTRIERRYAAQQKITEQSELVQNHNLAISRIETAIEKKEAAEPGSFTISNRLAEGMDMSLFGVRVTNVSGAPCKVALTVSPVKD